MAANCCYPNLSEIKSNCVAWGHEAQSSTLEVLVMTLPIGAYGLLVGLFGLVATRVIDSDATQTDAHAQRR